ncbi:MAG: hypothetical protein Q7R96_05415 [Nanoarchaeota archaeon]|nr:hypothetical protein [Nanoarchaeota archaeon]
MEYNVVLPVPDDIHASLDYIVKRFQGSCKAVHARGHRHVTLCVFSNDRSEDLFVEQLKSVEHVAVRVDSDLHPEVFSVAYPFIAGDPYRLLVAPCRNPPELQSLHEVIARAIVGRLDSKECEDHLVCRQDLDRGHACMYYGSPFFGEFYRPHITLARLSQDVPTPVVPLQFSWLADRFELWKKSGCPENDGWESVASFSLS